MLEGGIKSLVIVSESGQKQVSVTYQAFYEMWLSLLFSRQETKGTGLFKQSSLYLATNARRPLYTES